MTPPSSSSDALTGRVVRFGDADYAAASAGWNLLFSNAPQVIVYAQETTDVVNALAWSRRHESPSGCAAVDTASKAGPVSTTAS